ncbi:hypothetical protein C0989_002822 [Termitomyces sp. Mn162]|nr:hypothetical protein C0989_002822 [Termitomyces sp. Mn162]
MNVAWCTKSGRGTRVIPNGSLSGVHFVKTKDYVQVTGVGDLTFLNIQKGDQGGELDNRGADGNGNPSGGLVYGNTFGPGVQYHEWTSFISDTQFCFRACVGADATVNCNHIYDVMGCEWPPNGRIRLEHMVPRRLAYPVRSPRRVVVELCSHSDCFFCSGEKDGSA